MCSSTGVSLTSLASDMLVLGGKDRGHVCVHWGWSKPLCRTTDPERASDLLKGTEQGARAGIWILAFLLSIRKITVKWCFVVVVCLFISSSMSQGKFWAIKAQFHSTWWLCLPWAPEETVPCWWNSPWINSTVRSLWGRLVEIAKDLGYVPMRVSRTIPAVPLNWGL